MENKNITVISGPTGSGESTITQELIKRFPNRVCRLVTATTRPPRNGEQEGVDYYFFSKEKFLSEVANGNILEYGYIQNRDTYYGSYRPDLEGKIADGKIIIANTQIVGAKYFKQHYNATTIFISPESIDTLDRRVRRRSPELSEEEFVRRQMDAEREILEEGPLYDYDVINKDGKLEEAVDSIIHILQKEGYRL